MSLHSNCYDLILILSSCYGVLIKSDVFMSQLRLEHEEEGDGDEDEDNDNEDDFDSDDVDQHSEVRDEDIDWMKDTLW